MAYNNYSVSKKKASFYIKSATPQEGYEEVIYGTPPKKTYHQYQKNVKGTPSFFEVKEATFSDGKKMKFLELSLKEGENVNKISVPLKTKNGYTDEAKSFISALVGLKLNEPVSISLYSKKTTGKNGKEYENLSVYINYDNIKNDSGKSESSGYIKFEDIPKGVEKEVAGDKSYDFTAQTEFYYAKLQEIENKFKASGSTTSSPAPAISTTENNVVEEYSTEETDDLPF